MISADKTTTTWAAAKPQAPLTTLIVFLKLFFQQTLNHMQSSLCVGGQFGQSGQNTHLVFVEQTSGFMLFRQKHCGSTISTCWAPNCTNNMIQHCAEGQWRHCHCLISFPLICLLFFSVSVLSSDFVLQLCPLFFCPSFYVHLSAVVIWHPCEQQNNSGEQPLCVNVELSLLLQQQIESGLYVEGLSGTHAVDGDHAVCVSAVVHVHFKDFKHLNISEKEMLSSSGGPAVSLHCSVMWLDSSPTHSSLFTGLQQQRSCHVLLVLIRLFPAAGLTTSLRSVAACPKTLKKGMWWASMLRLISVSEAGWVDI